SDKMGDFRAILSMYLGHFGSLYPFRFRDWSDYVATNSVFGTGDGSTVNFQLSITYDPQAILLGTAGTFFYVRDIILLASTPVIKKAGVIPTPGPADTLSATGLVWVR